MRKYRLYKVIKDEVLAQTHYEAFLKFRNRYHEGFYSPTQADITYIEEVFPSWGPPNEDDYVNQTPGN